MNILPQLTQEEADQVFKNDLVLQSAQSTHHLAVVLKNTNSQFWSIPLERLLVILNRDIAVTLATFQANTELGIAINKSLDLLSLPSLSQRSPLEMGRKDIVFNGTQFVYVPPVAEAPVEVPVETPVEPPAEVPAEG